MRKIFLSLIMLSVIISCNVQQKAVVENDASVSCFSGSIWKFIPNNNTGKYMINQDNCTASGARNFRFTIPPPEADGTYYFMFKPINEKKQSTNNNAGYRMILKNLEDTKMTWTMTTSLEGKPFVITMNFNKLQ